MIVANRRITVKGILKMLDDAGGELFHTTKLEAWKNTYGPRKYHSLDEYFPSIVERVVGQLARQGIVEKRQTSEGIKIILTEKGKRKTLLYNLDDMGPKEGRWDGKWRIVFFDIEELDRAKRNKLRNMLKQVGLKQMQESVYVSPYEIGDEIRYLREILGIPHSVKLGLLESIENETDLKKWFDL